MRRPRRTVRAGRAALLAVATLLAAGCGGRTSPDAPPVDAPAEPPPSGERPPAEEPFPVEQHDPRVAVLGSAEKLRPLGAAEGPGRASIFAARNEFESFQIAVSAREEPIRGLTVALEGPLTGPGGATIPESSVTVYRVGYLDVRIPSDLEGAPGRWPDPLVPTVDPIFGEARNAFPVDVPAGENRVAWIDVLVPEGAAPGVYRGAIRVAAEGLDARVPVELTVLALTLPSTPTLKSAFGLSYHVCAALGIDACSVPAIWDNLREAEARAMFVRAALDNRITLSHPHAIQVTEGSSAGVEEFRTVFLPYLQGTAPTRLPGARLTTFQLNQVSDRRISGWRAELSRYPDVAARAFVYSCDEPYFFPVNGDPAGNWPYCLRNLEADRASWPEARRLVTAHIQTTDDVGATELIDIMVVNVELLHGPPRSPFHEGDQRPLYDPFLASGPRPKELWLYSACGSHGCTRNDDPYTRGWAGGYQVDGPASQTRAMAWLAFSHRLSGILYYDTVQQLARAWSDQYLFTGNGEGNLFYPGTPARIGGTRPIPVESLRMKHVRDGFEDFEYLAFLRAHGRGEDAHRVARALFPAPFDTTRSDAEIQAARRELGLLVAEVAGGPRP